MNSPIRVAVLPVQEPEYVKAISEGGGVHEALGPQTNGLIWTDSQGPAALDELLVDFPNLSWVQLPFAGVDNFRGVFDQIITRGATTVFTSAKGAYREPVAEHALMLALALARALPERIRAQSWGEKFAATLYDSEVLIIGGGGIAEELIRLLSPFRAKISIVRRSIVPMADVNKVIDLTDLEDALGDADFVFVASALTAETKGLFDEGAFNLMKSSAYFINIARGAIVDTAALERALRSGAIAGAGLDVTDPEPLPTGHTLWSSPNLIITPHTADTPEMCVRLLSERIVVNTAKLQANEPLVGLVNLKLGY
jgi:phosphoglycerate dehydrogenase-like enzyme